LNPGIALVNTFISKEGFRRGNKSWSWNWIIYAGLIAIVYGSLDEFLQTLISSRTGSINDWIINSAGAISALGIVTLNNKKT